MLNPRSIVFTGAILLLCSCVDPEGSFKDFEERHPPKEQTDIGAGCDAIPDVNGEFYLSLSPSIAEQLLIRFIGTVEFNVDVNLLDLSVHPVCVQEAQCTVDQLVGVETKLVQVEVDNQCAFTIPVEGIPIAGGANAISGADLIGELELVGRLVDEDHFCGIVNGDAINSGVPVNIDGSNFGAVRIEPGTIGADLPEPFFACPPEE